MEDLLFWADVETTGLDPTDGYLLEIAAYITDKDLNILDADGYHAVLQHNKADAMSYANDYVIEMHTKTGLWDLLETGTLQFHVDQELTAYLKNFAPEPRQARLAGNSVSLDAAFIREFLPHLSDHLHYRILDVSTCAFEAYNVRGLAPYEKKTLHSAKEDIEESIAELRYIRENH